METNQSLASESFSYSWLVNKTTPFDGLDEFLRSSSSARDPSFDFNTSISESSPYPFVHADEIFSNGHILPIFVDRSSKVDVGITLNTSSASVSAIPVSRNSVYNQEHRMIYCEFLKNWRKSSRKMIRKCFAVFRPLVRKVGRSRKCIRVDDIDRKVWEVQSQGNSLQSSPRRINKEIDYKRLRKVKSWSHLDQESVPQTPSYSTNVYCDIESSIYEAVLHCKRSIEN